MFVRNATRKEHSGYEVLDFLRSMSVLWLVCLHQQNQWMLQDYFDIAKFSKEEIFWWNGFVWSGHFSVDLFLLISGFLMGMIVIREQKRTGKRVNLLRFYWRRLLRIYPLLLVNFAAFYLAEVNLLQGQTHCQKNWWATLLFVNNIPQIIHYSDTCMLWTWSLALEMQFYVIISLILAATPNNIRMHKLACWAILLASLAIRVYVSIDIQTAFPPVISEFGGQNRWSFELYIPAYTRIGNLFVGVLAAIYEMEAKEIATEAKSSRSVLWKAVWFLSIAVVIVFPIVNWSAVLDQQCEFTIGCGCDNEPLEILQADNRSCSMPLDQCETYMRLSEKCGNTWLPYGIQVFLLASYRTIFCVAYGVIVYDVLVNAKSRRDRKKKPTRALRFFSLPIWFFIAQISYGMYLWNQAMIYVVQLLLFQDYFTSDKYMSFLWKLLILAVCILATVAFSMLTYVLVEKPFMDLRDYHKFIKAIEDKRRVKPLKPSPEKVKQGDEKTT